jgi:ribonuclease HI
MKELLLFSDGSVNTQTKVGYGAYLLVPGPGISIESLKGRVKIKKFEDTSSTKLELETLLWAVNNIDATNINLNIYTDSQNIINLTNRRDRLESNNFITKKKVFIDNHLLYKEYFRLADKMGFKLHKIEGHKPGKQKSIIDIYFSIVDRASRNALRMSKL